MNECSQKLFIDGKMKNGDVSYIVLTRNNNSNIKFDIVLNKIVKKKNNYYKELDIKIDSDNISDNLFYWNRALRTEFVREDDVIYNEIDRVEFIDLIVRNFPSNFVLNESIV